MGLGLVVKVSTPKGRGSKSAASSSLDDGSRPTLERVASSSLLPSPRKRPGGKPPQNLDQQTQIWGHMLSSPSPPSSPSRPGTSKLAPTLEEDEIDELEDDIGGADSEKDRGSSPSRPARRGSASSHRSRTQSLSPTRPTQSLPNIHHPQIHANPTLTRVREQTFSRTKSDVGPQRTNKRAIIRHHSITSGSSTSGSNAAAIAAAAAAAAAAKVTLEWACANVPIPSSPENPIFSLSSSTSTIRPPEFPRTRYNSNLGSEGPRADTRRTSDDMAMEEGFEDRSSLLDDMNTETEVDARTEFSDDTEAVTPSEGRSIASIGSSAHQIGIASASRSSGSPQSSFSSEFSAISSMIGSERAGVAGPSRGGRPSGPPDIGMGPFAKRAADMLGAAGIPRSTSRLPSGQGRTVRNPFNSFRSSHDLHGPSSSSRSAEENRSTIDDTSSMLASSPDEIEAALALCGLIASGRGPGL